METGINCICSRMRFESIFRRNINIRFFFDFSVFFQLGKFHQNYCKVPNPRTWFSVTKCRRIMYVECRPFLRLTLVSRLRRSNRIIRINLARTWDVYALHSSNPSPATWNLCITHALIFFQFPLNHEFRESIGNRYALAAQFMRQSCLSLLQKKKMFSHNYEVINMNIVNIVSAPPML